MKAITFKSHGKAFTIKKGDKLLELFSDKILVVTNPGDENDQNVYLSDGMLIPWTFFGGEYEPQKTKNRSLVMKRAHQLVKTLGLTFSESLKIAWVCSNSCLAGYAR